MYSNAPHAMVVFVLLATFACTAMAIQCTDVTKSSTCWSTIDDSGSDCVWCADASGICMCRQNGIICAAGVDCSSSGGGGGGGGGDKNGGEVAGIVIGVLVGCCCLVVCALVVAAAVVGAVFLVKKSRSGASA